MPTMLLPVLLTESEKVNVLGDLSQKLTALEAEKSAKKAATADYNERIKNLEGSIHGINESIKSGTCDRDVEVERRPNAFAGKVQIFRLDRDPPEFVREVEMDPDETQLRLGDSVVPGGKVTNLADHRTEEQALAGSPEEAEAMRAQRLSAEREERIAVLAAELTEKVTVETAEGNEGLFVGKIVHGEGVDAVEYEQVRDTADEAHAAVARHAAQHITAMAEEAAAAAATKAGDAHASARAERVATLIAPIAERIEVRPPTAEATSFLGHVEYDRDGKSVSCEAIGDTEQEARDAVREKLIDLFGSQADAELAEIERLAGEQAKDAAAGPKTFLKMPKGARKKRLQVQDEKGNPLAEGAPVENTNGVDTTPPPGADF